MKTTIKTLTLALVAILSFSSCSDDEQRTLVEEDFIGGWNVEFADQNIQSDGSLHYLLKADRTCVLEVENFLAAPEDQTHSFDGKWSYGKTDGNRILTISYSSEDPETGEQRNQTIRWTVSKFSGDVFHAIPDYSSQKRIFVRVLKLNH